MIGGIGALGGIDFNKTDFFGGADAASKAATTAAGGPSFLDALNQIAGSAVGKLGQAEALSVQALQGDVNTREVVDAVMSAEQSLQTAIAIRDKIVTAYLDLSRMAI